MTTKVLDELIDEHASFLAEMFEDFRCNFNYDPDKVIQNTTKEDFIRVCLIIGFLQMRGIVPFVPGKSPEEVLNKNQTSETIQ